MLLLQMMFSSAHHDASANFYLKNVSDLYGRIVIGDYCFIGMGSIIYRELQ